MTLRMISQGGSKFSAEAQGTGTLGLMTHSKVRSGSRVQGAESRVEDRGSRVKGRGCRVQGEESRIEGRG